MNYANEKSEAVNLFKSIDLKSNGFITLIDVDESEIISPEVFHCIDLNKKGKISLEEFQQGYEKFRIEKDFVNTSIYFQENLKVKTLQLELEEENVQLQKSIIKQSELDMQLLELSEQKNLENKKANLHLTKSNSTTSRDNKHEKRQDEILSDFDVSNLAVLLEKIRFAEEENKRETENSRRLEKEIEQKEHNLRIALKKQAELEENLKSFQFLKIKFKLEHGAEDEKSSLEHLVNNMLFDSNSKLNMSFVENNNFNLNDILHKSSETKILLKEVNIKLLESEYKLKDTPPYLTTKTSFKVIFLGDSGVGKTSLIRRIIRNEFEDQLSSTVGKFCRLLRGGRGEIIITKGIDYGSRLIYVDDVVVQLKLWDTAGQERYRSIVKSYYRDSHCFICMYDVTSEESFLNMRQWITSIFDQYYTYNFKIVIIANKIDLKCSRRVNYYEGLALAQENNALFFEISTKTCQNVFQSVEEITRSLLVDYDFENEHSRTNGFRPKNNHSTEKKCCT